jgi:hypothetical protein
MSMPDFVIDDPSLILTDPVPTLEIIDGSADPEYAAARASEVLDAANPRPQMVEPPDGQVALPAGWIDPKGVLHRTAQVRELTGKDEEKLSRINITSALPLYLRTLVTQGTEYIGNVEPSKEIIDQLLVGDREALILGIRIATYGDDVPIRVICPNCEATQDVAIELSKDVPVKTLDEPEVRTFDVPLRKGSVAVVQLATVAVQDEILAHPNTSEAELKTITLSKCVLSIDGVPATYDRVLNLGMADRKTILSFLAETQPGPDYEGVILPCPSCEKTFPIDLDLADLFRS